MKCFSQSLRGIFSTVVLAWPLMAQAGGQEPRWPVATVPAALRENAHAVLRQQDDILTVQSAGQVVHTVHRVVTVLDEQGEQWGTAPVWYDKLNQISYLRGRLYDASGRLVRALKTADVRDYSAVSDGSLFDDNRVRFADLRQAQYPYTVEFEYEMASANPLFFPTWQPQKTEHLSVEHATLRVVTPADLPLRYLEHHLPSGSGTTKGQVQGKQLLYSWQLMNQPALEREPGAPTLSELAPAVYTAPTRFEVQGYAGDMSSWQGFATWEYQLNLGRAELPAEVQAKVAELVKGITDERARVRKVYEYLQSSTRYISVQLGIGGWQTFPASMVASKGYGDCKALSNYCMALLKAAGVESYCALVGANQPDIQTAFPSNQFNHMILCVPLKADTVWLECTSQYNAFGYMGELTAGRHALLLTPQGGRLVRTPTYAAADNRQYRRAEVQVDERGFAKATVRTISTALQQDELAAQLHQLSPDEQRKRAYARLALAAVTIEHSSWQTDYRRALPAVVERLTLSLPNYASLTGRRLFLTPNLLNRMPPPPPRIGRRATPLVLSMPFTDADTVHFRLPAGYKPEAVPPPVQLRTAFGSYEAQVQVLADGTVQYVRRLQMPAGRFEPAQYEAYEDFRQRISKADRAQVVLLRPES